MLSYEEILTAMQERYRTLSGFDADGASDIGIRLKVLAQQVAALYERLEALRAQVFPQTSSGECLELHAQTRGLVRKAAQGAQGVLRFSREIAAGNDIKIGAGVICSTRPDPQVQFETTADGVLRAGKLYVDIPARAVEPGTIGNVAAGAVCLMVSAAAGISSVVNPAAFSGGVDGESDEALKNRLLQSYENISNGTNCAFYYDLAMQNEGVSSASVLPRKRGRGTVDVVVACSSPAAQADILAALQDDLNVRKEINVDVQVRAAMPDQLHIGLEVASREGFDYEIVAAKCREKVTACINGLGVGKPLLLAQLGGALLEVEGVYNYRVITPASDLLTASDHVLRAGAVSISRMAVG